jgi:hypothetical protein
MKLLQVTMGHASIMVTAHTYADLYDSDLDRVGCARWTGRLIVMADKLRISAEISGRAARRSNIHKPVTW